MFGCERLCYTVLYGVMLTVLQIILGTIGCEVLKKTPCPVLAVFLCHGQDSSIIWSTVSQPRTILYNSGCSEPNIYMHTLSRKKLCILYHAVYWQWCDVHSITNMSFEIVDAIINKKPRHRKKDNNDKKFVHMISILYTWGISEKFKWIGKRFNNDCF